MEPKEEGIRRAGPGLQLVMIRVCEHGALVNAHQQAVFVSVGYVMSFLCLIPLRLSLKEVD